MHSIYPRTEIDRQFTKPLQIIQYGMAEFAEIVRLGPDEIGGLAIHTWNRIVAVEKLPVDPFAVFPYIDHEQLASPTMVEGISKIINEPMLKEISYTKGTVDDINFKDKEVASLVVARVYPNNIHLADILYQNPYKPVPKNRPRFTLADYKGFGMLGLTLARLEDYGRSKGCAFVTLTAATDDLVLLFGKYGFKIEDTPVGRIARAMEKRL